MFKFLNKPYPFNDDLKHNAKLIFFISVGTLVFLFLFEPFDIGSLAFKEKIYLIIGLCIITFISLSLNLIVLPSIIPKLFVPAKWNVKKEILWNLWILFTISSGNLLFYHFTGIFEFDIELVFTIILYGVIPISVLITINQGRLLRSNLKSAIELNKKLQEKRSLKEKMVFFESDYQKDNLSIKVNSLIFVRSAKNYIEVFWLEDDKVKKQMVRSSLSKAEEILEDYKFIYKCHRSYLININYIEKIEGSYQGYQLYLKKTESPIPVSQKNISEFKEMI